GARVNSQTQGVAGPKHSSVLAKGFPSEREICRNLRHNDGYNPRILYTVSELFIHALTRLLRYWPGAGDVSRGFTKGSIRVPEGAFCVKLWRSVPLVSITYDSVLPFHGGNTGSNPVGDAKSFQQLTAICQFRGGDTLGTQVFYKAVLPRTQTSDNPVLGRALCLGRRWQNRGRLLEVVPGISRLHRRATPA